MWNSLLVLSNNGLGDSMMQANGAILPLLFCAVILVFCSTVLLKFLDWTPELSQSYFCLWIAV